MNQTSGGWRKARQGLLRHKRADTLYKLIPPRQVLKSNAETRIQSLVHGLWAEVNAEGAISAGGAVVGCSYGRCEHTRVRGDRRIAEAFSRARMGAVQCDHGEKKATGTSTTSSPQYSRIMRKHDCLQW